MKKSDLTAQVEQIRATQTERASRLDTIKQAIKDLGTGLPTLTKLREFLVTLKEIIHYEEDE